MKNIVKNLFSLIVSIAVVHVVYAGYLWPEADQILEASRQAGVSSPRNLIVILKDTEQEICLILMLWGITPYQPSHRSCSAPHHITAWGVLRHFGGNALWYHAHWLALAALQLIRCCVVACTPQGIHL